MKQLFLLPLLLLCTAAVFCSCSSTEDAKKEAAKQAEEEEDPVIRKAKAEWKKFVAEREAEEQRRHSMTTLQNDNVKVFPWKSGTGRRSEKLHEEKSDSIFKLW